MFHNTRITIAAFTLGALLAGGAAVYAQTVWQGTTSITNGQVIEPQTIKDNFDYLYERVNSSSIPEGYSLKYVNSAEDSYGAWSQTNNNTQYGDTCPGGDTYTPYTCRVGHQGSCQDWHRHVDYVMGSAHYADRIRNVSCTRAQALIKD